MIGCPLAPAVLSCTFQADRWIAPHLTVRTLFDYDRWSCRVTQPVRFSPLWPASWLPAVDKSRGSKSVEVHRVWKVCDDRLQFTSRQDALLLDESSNAGDVSQAWLVWSSAAETALADAYCFSGGPALNRSLILGRGKVRFRLVRLGGQKVRKVAISMASYTAWTMKICLCVPTGMSTTKKSAPVDAHKGHVNISVRCIIPSKTSHAHAIAENKDERGLNHAA